MPLAGVFLPGEWLNGVYAESEFLTGKLTGVFLTGMFLIKPG